MRRLGRLKYRFQDGLTAQGAGVSQQPSRVESGAPNYVVVGSSQESLAHSLESCGSESTADTRPAPHLAVSAQCPLGIKLDIIETYNDTAAGLERRDYARKMCQKYNKWLVESPHPHRYFLPSSRIYEVQGYDIETAVSKSRKTSIPVKNPERYRKIFFVLCLMKLPTKIRMFVEGQVDDEDLPLCVTGTGLLGVSRVLKSQAGSYSRTVKFRWNWDAEDFCKRQWVVLAPIFKRTKSTKIPHCSLHDRAVLPFVDSGEDAREGSYGKVTRIEISPDHHNLTVSHFTYHAFLILLIRTEKIRHLRCQNAEIEKRR